MSRDLLDAVLDVMDSLPDVPEAFIMPMRTYRHMIEIRDAQHLHAGLPAGAAAQALGRRQGLDPAAAAPPEAEMSTFQERKAERRAHWKAMQGLRLVTCSACSGSGIYDNTGSPACGGCDGTGKVREYPEDAAARRAKENR